MRPPRDASAESHTASVTPIYDALCSEYRRSFRALPGDRSGEEDLRFKSFGQLGGGPAGAGQLPGPPVPPPYPAQPGGYGTGWDPGPYARPRGPLPALPPALPPGRRDGRPGGF
ncbi:hypothetical protein [Streptomyces mashuensis]|nr:hypothetical protein [Streptomyces mashuensis]